MRWYGAACELRKEAPAVHCCQNNGTFAVYSLSRLPAAVHGALHAGCSADTCAWQPEELLLLLLFLFFHCSG
jgi:hypothetical protein